jgi:hypothetical protein
MTGVDESFDRVTGARHLIVHASRQIEDNAHAGRLVLVAEEFDVLPHLVFENFKVFFVETADLAELLVGDRDVDDNERRALSDDVFILVIVVVLSLASDAGLRR